MKLGISVALKDVLDDYKYPRNKSYERALSITSFYFDLLIQYLQVCKT